MEILVILFNKSTFIRDQGFIDNLQKNETSQHYQYVLIYEIKS